MRVTLFSSKAELDIPVGISYGSFNEYRFCIDQDPAVLASIIDCIPSVTDPVSARLHMLAHGLVWREESRDGTRFLSTVRVVGKSSIYLLASTEITG